MSKLSIRQFIEQNYPEYYSWNKYPAEQCAPIRAVKDEWGILGNFAAASVTVGGVEFCNTEQLFQMMKFTDAEALTDIFKARGMTIKMKAKKWQNAGKARKDWGRMIVDAMKFCLQTKYEQCEAFRRELDRSRGLFIVEDESGRKNTTWGTLLKDGQFEGSNLLGRLIMELRDNGRLEYNLSADVLDFVKHINIS